MGAASSAERGPSRSGTPPSSPTAAVRPAPCDPSKNNAARGPRAQPALPSTSLGSGVGRWRRFALGENRQLHLPQLTRGPPRTPLERPGTPPSPLPPGLGPRPKRRREAHRGPSSGASGGFDPSSGRVLFRIGQVVVRSWSRFLRLQQPPDLDLCGRVVGLVRSSTCTRRVYTGWVHQGSRLRVGPASDVLQVNLWRQRLDVCPDVCPNEPEPAGSHDTGEHQPSERPRLFGHLPAQTGADPNGITQPGPTCI